MNAHQIQEEARKDLEDAWEIWKNTWEAYQDALKAYKDTQKGDAMSDWTIGKIKAAMKKNGSYWWSKSSMAFFNTRVGHKVYSGPGGVFFVSSEKLSGSSRKYTVRQFNSKSCRLSTIGEFCVMKKSDAVKLAKSLAEESQAPAG